MTITEAERRRAKALGPDAATATEEGLQEGQEKAEVWHVKWRVSSYLE